MKREMRKWVALLLIPFVLVMTFGTTPVQAESKLGIHVDGAILIDAELEKSYMKRMRIHHSALRV